MSHRDNWRVLVAETLTGHIMADVVPNATPTYTRALTHVGEWNVDVLITGSVNSGVDFHAWTQSGQYSWVVAYGDYIVQAGPVTTFQFDDISGVLSVSGAGLLSLFDHRAVRNPRGSENDAVPAITNESEDLHYTGLSLRGIAAALLLDNMAQPGYALPLDIEEPEAGQAERSYYAYDLATVWTRLDELSRVVDGPELDCEPYFVPGENRIRWRLHIGNPLLGDQTSTAVWDYGGALNSINLDVDGTDTPAYRVWVKGDGTERGLLTGFAYDNTVLEAGFPPVDYIDSQHTSATEQDTLERYADQDLADRRYPSEAWSCSVRIDGLAGQSTQSPPLGSWALGDNPTFSVSEHPWLPDGGYRRRITGFTNEDVDHVSLTLAETPLTQLR